MVEEAAVVVAAVMEVIGEAVGEALVEVEEVEAEVVMEVAVVEDLVAMTGHRRCRATTRSLCKACPLMSLKMMLPSSLAPLGQSRLIERRANCASSSIQIETQALPRERAPSPMRTPVLHSLLSNGLTAKSSALAGPSKLAWP